MKFQKSKQTNKRCPKKADYLPIAIITAIIGIILISVAFFAHKDTKEVYTLEETSNIEYDVKLKENNFYSDEELKMDKSYPGSLIDKIRTNFSYILTLTDAANLSYNYKINAELSGKYKSSDSGPSEVWSKQYTILDSTDRIANNTKEVDIIEDFDLDYQKYTSIVTNFRQQLKLAIEAELNVKMTVQYSGEIVSSGKKFYDEKTLQMTLPLSTAITKISTDYTPESTESIIYSESINKPLLIVGIALFITGGLLGICIYKRNYKKIKSAYTKDLEFIIKSYSEALVEVEVLPKPGKRQVINIANFDDMVDAEEELKKPILYKETKKGTETKFFIMTEDCVYRFVLK